MFLNNIYNTSNTHININNYYYYNTYNCACQTNSRNVNKRIDTPGNRNII